MNVPYHSPFTSQNNPLALKLECIFSLTEEEKQALTSLPVHVMTLKGDQDIVRVGDRPTRCCLFLEGFGCTYKVTADGKRQILAFNPITQAEYGDALGITTVHVNRVMKELRIAGLVQTKGTVMTIPDWEALR